MKTPTVLVVLAGCCIAASRAVPLSMVMNSPGIVMPNSLDEDGKDGNNNLDDDFTTHPLERLSSAATCLVAGVEYTHGQQIYRKDQCEFCLCLDGEMFCWWEDCPPTLEGPCKNRGPFSPCQNGNNAQKPSAATAPSTTMRPTSAAPPSKAMATADRQESDTSTTHSSTVTPPMSSASEDPDSPSSTDSSDPAEDVETTAAVMDVRLQADNESDKRKPTTDAPKICTVMGRQYNIGDRLPHDTGNCVECVCGQKAQITCSPNQCAPSADDDVDEINDYRPPGLRGAQPDVF